VYEDYTPNLEPVEGATRGIAPLLKKGDLVILESTVNPGISDSIVMPILEKMSGLKCGTDFHLAHCPERINPGDSRWSVANINRVVGASDPEGLEQAAEFYESLISGTVMRMGSLKEAEAVKIVENSFRDINIAFVNELARSFAVLGIDTVRVIDGAATKPFAFMAHYPGAGVGGHCIPVDPYYLIEHAKKNGFHHDFLALARRINNGMPEYLITVVADALNEKGKSLKGSKIAVLGVAYKGNIDDHRESPSFHIIKLLKSKGATVEVYDPFVPSKSTKLNIETAIKNADAVVVATAHNAFKELSPQYFRDRGIEVIVDGRNCLDKDAFIKSGITYRGVGR
jgi:nucleotide sugar dehydrogenase